MLLHQKSGQHRRCRSVITSPNPLIYGQSLKPARQKDESSLLSSCTLIFFLHENTAIFFTEYMGSMQRLRFKAIHPHHCQLFRMGRKVAAEKFGMSKVPPHMSKMLLYKWWLWTQIPLVSAASSKLSFVKSAYANWSLSSEALYLFPPTDICLSTPWHSDYSFFIRAYCFVHHSWPQVCFMCTSILATLSSLLYTHLHISRFFRGQEVISLFDSAICSMPSERRLAI